jgi:hypothetical protein
VIFSPTGVFESDSFNTFSTSNSLMTILNV